MTACDGSWGRVVKRRWGAEGQEVVTDHALGFFELNPPAGIQLEDFPDECKVLDI
jgi:hypothetical protein